MNESRNVSRNYEQMAAELDELAVVPTEVLATRLCAGCPVRAECLEFELRIGGDQTVGVWGALNQDDRRALHKVWACRRRGEIERLVDEDGAQS